VPENKGRMLKKLAVYSTAVILVSSVAIGAGVWLTDVNVPVQYEQPFSIRMSDEERYDPGEVVGWQTISFKSTVERPDIADFSASEPENQYYTYVEIENPREENVTIEVEVREPYNEWDNNMNFTLIEGIVDPGHEEDGIGVESEGSIIDDFEVENKTQFTVIYELDKEAPVANDHEVEWEFREKDNEKSIWLADVLAPINYPDNLIIVETKIATNITAESADLEGELTYWRGYEEVNDVDVFFRWRNETDDEWNETDSESLTTTGRFNHTIEDLEENTTYEYKAVAENDTEEISVEGGIIEFTTFDLDLMEGDGSEDDPYQIANWNHLSAVRNDMNAEYELTENLTSESLGYDTLVDTEEGWDPIGTQAERFNGTFDGNNNKINDLYINRTDENNLGVFGHVGDDEDETIIERVCVKHANVTGARGVGILIGRVTGNDNTLIKQTCAVNGSVKGTGAVGGLIGSFNSWRETPGGRDNPVLNQSFAEVEITDHVDADYPDKFGGLVGCNQKGTIEDSYALGNVIVKNEGERIGGLAGCTERRGEVFRSYSAGEVDVHEESTFVGGFVGNTEGYGANRGIIRGSYWDMDTSSFEENEGVGGVDDPNGLTGLETDDMKGDTAEEDMEELNFDEIWETIEDGYPILRALDEENQLEAQSI